MKNNNLGNSKKDRRRIDQLLVEFRKHTQYRLKRHKLPRNFQGINGYNH